MNSSTSATVTGPQPDFTAAAECGRGLLLQLERCQNLPSVQDGAHWVTMSGKFDKMAEQMENLIRTVNTIAKDVAGLKNDVAGLKKDVKFLDVKLTALDQNSLARSENSLAKLASDTASIAPLMNIKTGHEIEGPTCLNDVRGMNAAELCKCLHELGIVPKSTNAEKRDQLLRAYGVQFYRSV
ncbi:hypothetical protein E4U30_007775 [Claviceps sp. LM220 group G6]|nr:hypothetical protein E4U30_007775 [Claviceps sp. LM220 group G6]KAG6103544.1 hypothetical protein E4U31_002751 [Claviceps sp. LM219 group G6]KAG6110532.1 hypothetical protein E4U14_002765 [Claviceps sp. LM454 group G7]